MSKIKSNELMPKVFLVNGETDIHSLLEGLIKHHQIIINLTNSSNISKCRIVDFLSGYVYALSGTREKFEDNIYCFTIK